MTTDSRPTLYADRHAISAAPLPGRGGGFAILEAGGNAIDAGCLRGHRARRAAPDEVNFAGVAPIMIRTADGDGDDDRRARRLAARRPRPVRARARRAHPAGILRTVVPAAPDAWIGALRDFGTMTFGDGRRAGDPLRARRLRGLPLPGRGSRGPPRRTRAGRRTRRSSCPAGAPPRVGERFVQPDLAATLQTWPTRSAGAPRGREAGLRAARDAFYRGDIAARIAAFHAENGGYAHARGPRRASGAGASRRCARAGATARC